MALQTSVTDAPSRANPGQLVGEKHEIIDARVDAAAGIAPGLVVLRTENGDRAAGFPASIAQDVDAIKTNIGSTAGVQNFTTADFNGAIGAGRIWPPAKIELVLSNHGDWDATNATLTGLDENGLPVSETLAIPNGGNATVQSQNYYSRVLTLSIPAQTGVGGTATLGVAGSSGRTLGGGDVLGVSVLDAMKSLEVTQSLENNEVYENDTVMPVLRKGPIEVTVENDFRAGDCPLVRLVAAGAEVLGAVRVHDTDGGDCVPWRAARFLNGGTGGTTGILDVNLP
jgi:hypothetical protein